MLEIDLRGKVAIVTGVSSGIGVGIAKMMARAGCNIVGCGTSSEESEGAKRFIDIVRGEHQEAIYCSLDITGQDAQKRLINSAVEQFGTVDILVSNAGVNMFEGVDNCSEEQWEQNMNINLKVHWQLSKVCKPWLERSGSGTIILITSNHSDCTMPNCFPYNVAKTAIKGLVQSLALEWGPSIRTVGVAPGFIDSESNNRWFNSFSNPSKERERTVDIHPVKRLGTVDEVGGLTAFLCSDMAQFISGATYLIDGGRSASMQDF